MKLSGILISTDGTFSFRQYLKNGEFVDYNILHNDLEITINDPSATIREDKEGNKYIDYSDEILGK